MSERYCSTVHIINILLGRGNRQIQTSTNRTNVRKALRLALSSLSEVIAILKGLKNARTK